MSYIAASFAWHSRQLIVNNSEPRFGDYQEEARFTSTAHRNATLPA